MKWVIQVVVFPNTLVIEVVISWLLGKIKC
jgi:hypothetical protein